MSQTSKQSTMPSKYHAERRSILASLAMRCKNCDPGVNLGDVVESVFADLTRKNAQLKLEFDGAVRTIAVLEKVQLELSAHLDEREKKLNYRMHSHDLAGRTKSVIQQFESTADQALNGANDFRNDTLVMFKSLEVVVESVSLASSHTEKNARLRGLAEVLRLNVAKLRDLTFDFRGRIWDRFPDTFRWDQPERRLLDRVRELEAENKILAEKARMAGGAT